nr:olfactory receptor 18 [Tropidothorax elegans]
MYVNLIQDKLDIAEQKKVLERGYRDVKFVLLRNGGMFLEDDGNRSLRNIFWKVYPFFHFCWFIVLFILLSISLYVERTNVDNFLEGAHYAVMILSLACGNVDFFYYRSDLNILLRHIGQEFFQYDEEEPEIHKEMKRKNLREVKLLSQVGVVLYFFMGFIISIIQPYVYYLAMKDEPLENERLNPFLPVPMYFPWDTFSTEGFVCAYILQFVGSILIVSNVIANGFSYVNLMVLFRCQFEILNHSIKNIETRSLQRYKKKYGTTPASFDTKNDLQINKELEKCFFECLRQNIMHHQCLIRWEITSRKMLRVILLFVFFNASILMASTGYLLMKNLHSKVRTMKFIQLLITEIFHTFLFCFYGEQISHQNEELFQNLYGMEWYKYGPKFNSLLIVMMTVTVKPLQSRTAIFNTPCSLETFNSLMSTAYSYFSVINGMKENI